MVVEAKLLSDARSTDPELATPRSVPSRIKTVLLATDLTAASKVATAQAVDLAASIGARLLVVNVIAPDDVANRRPAPFPIPPRFDQQRAGREAQLLAIIEEARGLGVDATFLLWSGEPAAAIVAAAEAERADLIVVGTRGLDDAGRFLLGSVSDHVVHDSSCPVLVAH
jgi:nucleotide-binding universal stress UspA family protein